MLLKKSQKFIDRLLFISLYRRQWFVAYKFCLADYRTFDATLMNFVASIEKVGCLSEQFCDNYENIA